VVVVVVVAAGCSDAQELRIIPRTGSAKVKISFFIIWNSYHDQSNFTTFDGRYGLPQPFPKVADFRSVNVGNWQTGAVVENFVPISAAKPDSTKKETAMGLSWQQGPLSPGAIGRFLVREPLPKRLLYAEPLRRRMRVRFGGKWIADSEGVLLLFEPGRYPIAYFPEADVSPGALQRTERTTQHRDLGLTSWYTVRAGEKSAPRGAWQYIDLRVYASELQARVAFAWPLMEGFYEEDERILGHAADSYHRIDIRQASRRLVVRHHDRMIADTKRPVVLYESGFAPRWYAERADVDESTLSPVEQHQTFCPYKGLCSYYDIGDARLAAWSYRDAYAQVGRISGLVSFEPDIVSVQLDGVQLRLEPGQSVIPHGPDRDLTVAQVLSPGSGST
jgi:uncharacterized protein (DUF427 family)